ncbi:pyridoxamine 5'-phosphate oxidase family protein [Phosphitispora fastidiosa]|uniref:pyridoxamine 5'-phosphate oxidase family protein n=1 Tax=Phosphitispora fastidiosa TaxID=2837202 RepID=UPI001E3D0939|nr:pyridoxamine 5'-phosphate oxidase family protein [Phosphitispora fastidiosa]MBU7005839.1 putative pyridoxine 5'-phosphate oxidase superfamily flavin-nucleotide-binding protein [Phosphitispora fastidiosa]
MAGLTDEVKGVIEKSKGWAFATADVNGNPNVVSIAFGKVLSESQVMLIDVFMDKSLENITENPKVAVSVWDMDTLQGYQLKGNARVETNGELFDEGVKMVKSIMPQLRAKGVVLIDIEKIYVTSPGPDIGKELC